MDDPPDIKSHKGAFTSFNVQPLTIIADDEAITETKHSHQPIKTSDRESVGAAPSLSEAEDAPT